MWPARTSPRVSTTRLEALTAPLGLLFLWLSMTSALPQTAGSALADIASYNGPDRTAKLIAGGEKGRCRNVYTSETIEDIAVLSAAFTSNME